MKARRLEVAAHESNIPAVFAEGEQESSQRSRWQRVKQVWEIHGDTTQLSV
jgi:hypothetical protein